METNRSPFDFAEGESELVSGFKTEYSSLVFAYLFLGEYGRILFIRTLTVLFFINWFFLFLFVFFSLLLRRFFIWSRSTLPRFRYDFLMTVCWKILLPTVLVNLLFFFI